MPLRTSVESDPAELDAEARTPAVTRAVASLDRDRGGPSWRLERPSGSGPQRLSPSLQRSFEQVLGADLAGVRLHAGTEAERTAAGYDAAAVTYGREIWFGVGRLEPTSDQGRQLLAHELIHVADHAALGRVHRQPTGTRSAPGSTRRTNGPGSGQDPVVLIEVSKATGAAVLTTRSGARIDGRVTDLSLEPGAYALTPSYRAHIWSIAGAPGGLRFTLTIPDPATAHEDPPGLIDPFDMAYENALLRVTQADTAQAEPDANFNLGPTLTTIGSLLDNTYVSGAEERQIVALLEAVPAAKSQELLRRLSERRPNGRTWFEDLDSRISGENNQRLHEALSLQRLRSAPERAVAALVSAPVLPWHDVMGFFEDAATFTAERATSGRVRVRYLGGSRLIGSREFGSEIANLPLDIFIGGVEYEENQPLIIHDYDSGRFVTVVAGELAGYEHLGIRNFLGHVATVASFAIPVSAAESVAGRIAVVALERVLPAIFLLVDENRRNLVRWFPNWGPQMVRYSDTLKTFAAAVGFARLAISGFQIFQQWRTVARSRAALEGAARADSEAERVAAALERQAEQAYTQAEQVRTAEGAATARPGATGATGTISTPGVTAEPAPLPPTTTGQQVQPPPGTTTPRTPPATTPATPSTPAVPHTPATPQAAAARAWEGINDETRAQLNANSQLREALEHNPLAAEALKACHSLCYPRFVQEVQITRLERALELAEETNISINLREVQRALHAAENPAALDRIIAQIESGVSSRIQVGQEFLAAQQTGGNVPATQAGTVGEGFYLTSTLRNAPGAAHSGINLPVRTRLLEPGIGTGPMPGQIAERLRRIGHFNNFEEFRETFWRLVAADGRLNQGWRAQNLARMRNGQPPFVGRIGGVPQATGGGANAVLQLNHIRAIKNAGGVYDLSNIEIVTPRFHATIGD